MPFKPLPLQDFSLQKTAHAQGEVTFHWLGHPPSPGFALKPEELPGVTTLGYWETRTPKHGPNNKHYRNPELQISFYEHGEGMELESLDGARQALFNHALILTLPWESYITHHVRGICHWINLDVGVTRPNQKWTWPDWIILTPEDRKELAWRWRQRSGPVMAATPELREAFAGIAKAVKAHEAGKSNEVSDLAIRINALLLALLRLLRAGPEQQAASMDSRNEKTVRLFWEGWDRDPANLAENLATSGMARACGLSTTTFGIITKHVCGETPAHRILSRRLERAARLLRNQPERLVLDIAIECGFSSSQYFATCFTKRHKMTPLEWRKRGAESAAG